MGDFSNSTKWKLVNDFTIHEDRNLNDRPFMLTCVPKALSVHVTAFEVIRNIEWPSNFGQDKPEQYADSTYIEFSGDLDDKIIVFSVSEGEIARFQKITDAIIRPLPIGRIGGKHKATVFNGIEFSGMSSKEVPNEGLMEDEPGRLLFMGEFHDDGRRPEPESLHATLFLDEDKFSRLVASLSLSPKPVNSFELTVLAELFETEVSASLSEAWMSRNYGLLKRGEKDVLMAGTRARIESLSFSTGRTTFPSDHDPIEDIDRSTTRAFHDPTKAVLKYQRYIFAALLVLIAVTAFHS